MPEPGHAFALFSLLKVAAIVVAVMAIVFLGVTGLVIAIPATIVLGVLILVGPGGLFD